MCRSYSDNFKKSPSPPPAVLEYVQAPQYGIQTPSYSVQGAFAYLEAIPIASLSSSDRQRALAYASNIIAALGPATSPPPGVASDPAIGPATDPPRDVASGQK
ncbi:unnamed protein product [Rotaria sordida]|uniref:Uncharacterized protein n=1 Tax=Rotaria sordida TaxID=392033 RepID=A0A815RKB1_9BILA|nr:unnamed protein product [Rotaria sordida]